MLHNIPEFDLYYVAYLKDDAAKEPIATSYSAPGVLADAAHKTRRAKADFELQEISREEYERSNRCCIFSDFDRPLSLELFSRVEVLRPEKIVDSRSVKCVS
jgi:hypothetical protein